MLGRYAKAGIIWWSLMKSFKDTFLLFKKNIGATIAILGVFAYSLAEEAEKKAKKGVCMCIHTNACKETY